MGKVMLFITIICLLFAGQVQAQNLQGAFRGEEEFASYLLLRGEEFWEELRGIFRVRPPSPVHISFYDGRLDYLKNKPHPSAPESIDALLLFNRIHFVVEKRRPYSNELVLFHELVHIFQREYYSLTPHNVWFSDFQSEYLVGLHFFGPEYHAHLRQNLNFDPDVIRGRLGRDMDWRYNRSLGLIVIDYLLDKYRLRPDLMHQLVIAMESENLLNRHQQVVSSALDFLEENPDLYAFVPREELTSLPPAPGFIPSPATFSRENNSFIFHSFFLNGTYHSLGTWNQEEKAFSPYLVSENYLDWPVITQKNDILYVRQTGDQFEIVLGNKEEPEKEILFRSPEYLSNLSLDRKNDTLFFGQDQGAYRHLYSLAPNGNIHLIADGPYQNWSPFPGENNDLFFLSDRTRPDIVPGGDLFLYREGETIELTFGLRFLDILDRDQNRLLIKFIHQETGAEALGIFNTETGNWDKTITRFLSTPYFPHLVEGEIMFWQSPFN